MKYIFELKSLPEKKALLAGGKAGSLSHMLKNTNIRIPKGYVILADASSEGKLKEDAKLELKSLCEKLDTSVTYAVRSSALNEDGCENSFAGQYETVTDVKVEDIPQAVDTVINSSGNERVLNYSATEASSGIGVVIQRFVKPEFAGVIFTSDAITGRDDHLTGNFVQGEGEALVSGVKNASEFTIDTIRYKYRGPSEMKPYAKTLYRYCMKIRRLYGIPMDIEWAVSGSRVYILQARPITTLRRLNIDTYEINGTMSGCKLLTRTNVGEIFMKPVSPMTFSVLEKINTLLGLPDWLDNICGQAYMNISILCSLQVSFGTTPRKAAENIESLLGKVPEDLEIPVSPFNKKDFIKNVLRLIFPKEKSKLSRKQMHQMVLDMDRIADDMIVTIKSLDSNFALIDYWDKTMLPSLNDGLASILKESGTSLAPLFSTRNKIAKIAGDDLADRLCGGCLGVVESMKPLLLIGDVESGILSRDKYMKICGHRCVNEMELMEPRPYEQPDYMNKLLEDYRKNPTDMHALLSAQRASYEEALKEFKEKYPSRSKWIDKTIARFVHANTFREQIRSKGVRIFCIFREFLLQAARINDLGDDVFMFTWSEFHDYLKGDTSSLTKLPVRRAKYNEYLTYPNFPNLICGRFDPKEWMSDPSRRNDHFISGRFTQDDKSSDICGFPGAAGTVTGRVKVITDIDDIDLIEEGDILVTTATNIGWTPAFSKVSAIVTDIGAPLSHAAIVAREFGIPAVVGCGNATTLLKTGDKVTVNGAAGTVKIEL